MDAEKFWQKKVGSRYRSGIWIEHESSGSEYQLEAFAISLDNQRIVVIQPVAPEDRQMLVQKAREKSLDNIRLTRSERNARRSEQRLRKFLDALPDWIFRVKEEGTLLDLKVSKGKDQNTFTQFIGKNISEIFPLEIAEELLQCVREAKKTGEIQTSRFRISADETYEARIVMSDQGEALFILRELANQK